MWTFTRPALADALHRVAPALSTRDSLPILKSILVHFQGDTALVRSSDLSMGLTATLPVTGQGTTGICLPGAILLEIVEAWYWPEGVEEGVTVEVNEATRRATISAGRHTAELAGRDPDDFPALSAREETRPAFRLPADTLLTLITQVKPAINATQHSGSETMRHLLIDLDGDRLTLIGADGIRLHVAHAPVTLAPEGERGPWLIPYRSLADLQAVLRQWGATEITVSGKEGSALWLDSAYGTIIVRVAVYTPLPWRAIIARRADAPDTAITLDRADLLDAITVLHTLAKQATLSRIDSASLWVDVRGPGTTLRADASDYGSGSAQVDSSGTIPDRAPIQINSAMLHAAVKAAPGPQIILRVPNVPNHAGEGGAIRLSSPGAAYEALIMPLTPLRES